MILRKRNGFACARGDGDPNPGLASAKWSEGLGHLTQCAGIWGTCSQEIANPEKEIYKPWGADLVLPGGLIRHYSLLIACGLWSLC